MPLFHRMLSHETLSCKSLFQKPLFHPGLGRRLKSYRPA